MKNVSSGSAGVSHDRLRLNVMQHAWLAEIGLEQRILSHYLPVQVRSGELMRQASKVASVDTMQEPATGSDLAMAALKQAGGRRRPPAADMASSEAISASEQSAGRPVAGTDELPADWEALRAHAEACRVCGLHTQRDQLVFGAGEMRHPDWLIVGEAPGQADDRTGQPFQGRAGKLLHAMLVAAGVYPSSVALGGKPLPTPSWSQPATMYFSNLIKCRPLGNRSPDAAEVAACKPYLTQQIGLLQPARILALGRLAAQAILGVDADVEDLRGQIHHITTVTGVRVPVVVTWHPAVLLMHPQNKGQAWEDLNMARRL